MKTIDTIISETLEDKSNIDIPVGVSSRHVHLSEKEASILFPDGLTNYKDLSQPGQFACDQRVDLIGKKGTLKGVRVLGPLRNDTQVEISKTDAYTLGIDVPIRMSGVLDGTPGVVLVSPYSKIEIQYGLIVAQRHIHMHPSDALSVSVSDGDNVWVIANTNRRSIIGDVIVRVKESYALDFHIDIDEANAFGLNRDRKVRIVRKEV